MRRRATLLLAAAATAPSRRAMAEAGTLRGTATYRERIALPPGAVLEVMLEETSRADAPAARIAEARVVAQHQVPIPFALTCDMARIDPRGRYAVRATLGIDGRAMFRTDGAHPVALAGDGAAMELRLVRAAGADASAPAALVGPRWIATEIAGDPSAPGIESDITFAADGAAHGAGGCNRIRGGYRLSGADGIAFGAMAATMMACDPPRDGQERGFLDALGKARRWSIEDGSLLLRDGAGTILLRLRRG